MTTIPSVLAQGPALHSLARVELCNGALLTGRITAMDPETLNIKMDGLNYTAVRRLQKSIGGSTKVQVEENPVALRSISSIVLRGSQIRYIDFISETNTGGRGLEEIIASTQSVAPLL